MRDIFKSKNEFSDKKISIGGWVRTTRRLKNFGFIELNDGSCFKNIQIVYDDKTYLMDETDLCVGAAIIIQGILRLTPLNKQPFELYAEKITLEGASSGDFPIQKKRHSTEFLRTEAYLRPRTNTFSAVFRVRSVIAQAIHTFFQSNGFVYVHTPILTSSDCEGAGEMFTVTSMDLNHVPLDEKGVVDYSKDFFGKKVSLSVSGQLSAETMALALRDVYTFGPTFRAENSNTQRHAAEFWMVEPEMAFADLEDNMDNAEALLKFIIKFTLDNAPDEMEFLDKFVSNGLIEKLKNIEASSFERITYTKAVELLLESGEKFEYPVEWGIDLQTEHERYITEKIFKKPVFVTDYPKGIKAFYMRLNDDGKTVAACDLLVPGIGEIIGGSQREERYDVLAQRMEQLGMNKENYWWYLNLRRFGSARHSGYGLGFERAVMYITGVSNIRDVIPYPRTVKNAEF